MSTTFAPIFSYILKYKNALAAALEELMHQLTDYNVHMLRILIRLVQD